MPEGGAAESAPAMPVEGLPGVPGPSPESFPAPMSYRRAGVDIKAGEEAVARIAPLVASTARPEVLGSIGGFGGCFLWPADRYRRPVLVATTDGVGTKLQVARAAGRFATIGVDLVAMCVDDLVCVGAEPLFLVDYLAVGHLDPEQIEQIVSGIADGCRQAGCALLGGEMAEHPGVMAVGDVDVAGFAVGVVEAEERLGPHRVRDGDVLIGLVSPGLRANGYSLARQVLLPDGASGLDEPAWEGSVTSLGDELLLPSVIYAPVVREVLGVAGAGGVRAAAHITGGGLPGNLCRVLPPDLDAQVHLGSWPVPRIFEEIRRRGPVDDAEMASVFNLGLGMVLMVAPEAAGIVETELRRAGQESFRVGSVAGGSGRVQLQGTW